MDNHMQRKTQDILLNESEALQSSATLSNLCMWENARTLKSEKPEYTRYLSEWVKALVERKGEREITDPKELMPGKEFQETGRYEDC